jgi:predicted nucleic acid-binding protein
MAREDARRRHGSRLRQDPLEGSPGASLSYLVDTNVLSELRKGARGNENVRSWFSRVAEEELYLSVLVVGDREALKSFADDPRHGIARHWLSV